MDENELKNSYWPVFFLVTGFCFLIFYKMIHWLEGTWQPVLIWAGIISIFVGLLTSIFSLTKKSEKN